MFKWIQTFYKLKASVSVLMEKCGDQDEQREMLDQIMLRYSRKVTLLCHEEDRIEDEKKDTVFDNFLERDEKGSLLNR